LRNEGLHDLHFSPGIIRERKSRGMRWACGTYGWRGKLHTDVSWENVKERGHLEDNEICGRVLQMNLQEREWRGVEWIDRDTKRALVSKVMSLRVP